MHTQVYCKQLWSEQSDKCRYSCIKNSSQLGCVSTRPLFLSATTLFPIFSTNAANKYYKWKCWIQHLFLDPVQALKVKHISTL